MSSIIVFCEGEQRKYVDKKNTNHTVEELAELDAISSTVYVGGLANTKANLVTEDQIYTVFSQSGRIKKIIMGIYREDNSPAGFCFVEYYYRDDALAAIKWLKETYLYGRILEVNIDYGFEEGRQFRRYRKDFNPRPRDRHRRRMPHQSPDPDY